MLTLERIEALAPDQASLEAARKLLDSKKWPVNGVASDQGFIWGECQGSGSTPYRACVSVADLGYKCTCPSRKFPCKHNLALMWRYLQKPREFATGEIPQWVLDWSFKRRSTGKTTFVEGQKDITATTEAAPETESPQDSERAAKARERNQQQREAAIQAGLDDFYLWLTDVYDRGLLAFLQNSTTSCRQAAKRLVDAKASGLASQLDELASAVLQIPEPERPRYLHQKLSSLYLLAKAYQRLSQLPDKLQQDVRRLVGWNLSREQLLQLPDVEQIKGNWRVLAVREYLQNDGLRRTETWLGLLGADDVNPKFAVLVDYAHVSAGVVVAPFKPGEGLAGTVVYFPSATPLRGVLVDYTLANCEQSHSAQSLKSALSYRLAQRSQNPWLLTWPLTLIKTSLVFDQQDKAWLSDGEIGIPLHSPDHAALLPLLGLTLHQATVTWDGWQGDLLHADTDYGFWSAAA